MIKKLKINKLIFFFGINPHQNDNFWHHILILLFIIFSFKIISLTKSNDKKNKPQSTITKLIDYFNKDEEKEEENINNQKSEMKSYDISEKFYRLYSMRDENEVEQNNNQINSNTKDNINKEINNNNILMMI